MRFAIALLSVPLLAATTSPQLRITCATLTLGAGVEPKGGIPPGRFSVDLQWTGAREPVNPRFLAWRIKASDAHAVTRGTSPRRLYGAQAAVEVQVQPLSKGQWQLVGTAPEGFKEGDQLCVELWSGKRRQAWAVTGFQILRLPSEGPRPSPRGDVP